MAIAHKGRLALFGFDYLGHVAEKNGRAILVANQESLSPQEEMVQDLLAIVHTFSCRLQGLRGYEKLVKDKVGAAGEDHSCRVFRGPERGQG